MSSHELTQIFYDGLGPQDRYLLNATSGDTFMSKHKDEAIKLIETMAGMRITRERGLDWIDRIIINRFYQATYVDYDWITID